MSELEAEQQTVSNPHSHSYQQETLENREPESREEINKEIVEAPIQEQRQPHVEQPQVKATSVAYSTDNYCVELSLRKKSLKIKITKKQNAMDEEKPQQLSDLFENKESKPKKAIVILTRQCLPAPIKQHFKSIQNLYNFIYDNIQDKSILAFDEEGIRLLTKGIEGIKEMKINMKDVNEQKSKKATLQVNLENMEDRLLQFNNSEMDLIEQTYDLFTQQEVLPEALKEGQQMNDWLQYINQNDEEYFLEKQADNQADIYDSSTMLKQIEQQERAIEEFEKVFPQFKVPITFHSNTSVPKGRGNDDRMTSGINPSQMKANGPFPPGYVPPHLAKQTAHDGLNSDQHLRFQANQTKKEKLKMAKNLLKMGFSTAQVIQRLQAQERPGRSGYVDPSATSTPQSKTPAKSAPSSTPKPITPPQQQNGNERAVREMMINLIRAKTYSKLDQIQKHMADHGLITTIQTLKRMVDQIKAKNAQRRAQAQAKAQNTE